GFGYDSLPGWAKVITQPVEERMRIFADPSERIRLDALAQSDEAGLLRLRTSAWSRHTVHEAFSEANKRYEGRVVGEIAAELGQEPFDVMLDIALRDELRTVFIPPPRGDNDRSWELKRDVWKTGKALIGGSDAGAHVDFAVSYNYATKMLAACRERQLIPLEEAIRMLTDVPARFYGIRDRGRVVEGHFADLMVFDPAAVDSGPVHWRDDLPGGAGRLYAHAEGINHVIVNGTEIVRDKQFTGVLPGTVLRSGRDTDTVAPVGFGRE